VANRPSTQASEVPDPSCLFIFPQDVDELANDWYDTCQRTPEAPEVTMFYTRFPPTQMRNAWKEVNCKMSLVRRYNVMTTMDVGIQLDLREYGKIPADTELKTYFRIDLAEIIEPDR
jgi:hypothetical protein